MSRDTWHEVIARVAQEAPVDLDPILDPGTGAPAPAASAPGPTVAALPPSARLWERDDSVSYIGIRVEAAPRDIRRLALRLAAAAVERGVVPVILSALPRTGFEQFGFRVERLPDGPPEAAAACEAELCRFWDMAIVLDLSEVEGLG